MTDIDHAAEAEVWLANADDEYTREPPIRENIRDNYQRAQIHATLALVDQARIANLIALSQAEDGNGWQAEEPLAALYTYVRSEDYDLDGDNGLRIRDDIKKGLGL